MRRTDASVASSKPRYQAQAAHLIGQCAFVENAQHCVLAGDAGHDRYAHVDLAPLHRHAQASVLRDATLADVQLRHHLDARDHLLGGLAAGDAAHAGQHAVDAVLDVHAGERRLQMNVARLRLDRIVQSGIDQLHHRAGIRTDAGQGQILDRPGLIGWRCRRAEHLVDGAHALLARREIGTKIVRMRERERYRRLQYFACPGFDAIGEGIGNHQQRGAVLAPQQHAAARTGLGIGDEIERRQQG